MLTALDLAGIFIALVIYFVVEVWFFLIIYTSYEVVMKLRPHLQIASLLLMDIYGKYHRTGTTAPARIIHPFIWQGMLEIFSTPTAHTSKMHSKIWSHTVS